MIRHVRAAVVVAVEMLSMALAVVVVGPFIAVECAVRRYREEVRRG